jgi:spore maturation protein CgeB
MEMLFDPEHELSFFRTIDEGIQRRDDLLQSSQRARKKAQAAKKRILKQHTYKERALQALRALRTDSI